ncbi:MAG: helix-turn-helix domain-containing protein, partial [Gammaproteobacteria bacterium]|nr:helix-turn-helix domain-containing protein [Gammaproteobacteria bacterium]
MEDAAMTKCKHCGSTEFRLMNMDKFGDTTLIGIPVVLFDAVKEQVCAACGEVRGHLIPNVDGLTAAAAVMRATLPWKLTGKEIRFLRKSLGWRAKDLAAKLDVTAEHVSKWENGHCP